MGALNKLSVRTLKLFAKHHLTDQPTNYPQQDKDLGIISLGLNLEKFYKKLLSFQKIFDIRQVEKVFYKDNSYPIYEVEINEQSSSSNKEAKKKLFIISGTHGNEQAGILCTLDLLKDIQVNPSFYKKVHILILVPNNPVGAQHFSRFNGNGIDINRDYKKRRTIETSTTIASMKRFKQDFTLSLHEGPQESGTFIYCNKLVNKQFALRVLNYAKRRGVKLASNNYFGGRLKIPGYFPHTGLFYNTLIKLW